MLSKLKNQTIFTNILAQLAGSATAQALAFIVSILIARKLGPFYFGQYTSALTLVSFTSIVYSLGLEMWMMREGGRSGKDVGRITGGVFFLRASIGMVWLAAIYFLAPLLNQQTFPASLVRLSAAVIFITSLFNTTITGYRSALKHFINASLQFASSLLLLLATLVLYNQTSASPQAFMAVRFLVMLVSLVLGYAIAVYAIKLILNRTYARLALNSASPFALSELMTWLFMRMDALLISFFLGGLAVGIFSPAENIINNLFIIPASVHFVLLPTLSNYFSSDAKKAWRASGRFLIVFALIGAFLFLLTYFGSQYLVLLLGGDYAGSVTILKILSGVILLHSINFGLVDILVSTNQQTSRTIVQVLAVAFNLILNLLVIKRAGIQGVAYVYLITEVFLFLGYAILVFISFRKYRRDANLTY